ncbi:MAG: hypothetical protein P8M22_08300, partial [Phycisphaerales bacterium]|nr:hypothetical protein [Phycisphaerales bacterium]
MSYRFSHWPYLTAMFIMTVFLTIVAQQPTNVYADNSEEDPFLSSGRSFGPIMPTNFCEVCGDCCSGSSHQVDSKAWNNMAWQTFISLNWPHEPNGNPGQPMGCTNNPCDPDPGNQCPDLHKWQTYSFTEIIERFNNNYTDPDNYPDTVWWSYNNKFQMIRNEPGLSNNQLNPGPWNSPKIPKPTYPHTNHQIIGGFSKSNNATRRLGELFDDAVINRPLIDRNGKFTLYQIFVNQSYWEWVEHSGYFDKAKQIEDVQNSNHNKFIPPPTYGTYASYNDFPGGFPGFPGYPGDPGDSGHPDVPHLPVYAQQGALSIKVAWRQLNENDNASRYYTRKVYYQNNNTTIDYCGGEPEGPITVGMVGMHIFRYTPETGPFPNGIDYESGTPGYTTTGFWMTFEHVDNVKGTPSEGTVASYNSDCPPALSGYTYQGNCTDAVPDLQVAWPLNGPPPSVDDVDHYLGGLCSPQSPDKISQVYRIAPSQANLNQSSVAGVNAVFRKRLRPPFHYYQLVNTIQPLELTTDFPQDFSQTNATFIPPIKNNRTAVSIPYLTNTSLEPYTQYNFLSPNHANELAPVTSEIDRRAISCINCHAFAGPAGAQNLNSTSDCGDKPCDPSWYGLPDVYQDGRQIMSFLIQQAGTSCSPDINLDSDVDTDDLLLVVEGWGDCDETYC